MNLDLDVARIPERVRHVGLHILTSVPEPVRRVMWRKEKRAGTGGRRPVLDGGRNVWHEERLLERNSDE